GETKIEEAASEPGGSESAPWIAGKEQAPVPAQTIRCSANAVVRTSRDVDPTSSLLRALCSAKQPKRWGAKNSRTSADCRAGGVPTEQAADSARLYASVRWQSRSCACRKRNQRHRYAARIRSYRGRSR